MTKRALTFILAAIAALAVPAGASAAPKFTGTLDASTTEFKYSGGPIHGGAATQELADANPCGNPGHDCEDALVSIPQGGDLTVKLEGTNDGATDLDLYLIESDASGKEGKELRSSTGGTAVEGVANPKLKPGFYIIRVDAALSAAGTYDVTATLKNAGGATTPSGPGTTPPGGGGGAVNAAPTVAAKVAKSSKSAKLKSFKGTAGDDKGVAKIEIALYQVKGKTCSAMDAKGAFKKAANCDAGPFLVAKGTTKWSFKLKKKLKKGGYTLAVRATDSEGATTITKANFKVK
jgi:hypothetical protein